MENRCAPVAKLFLATGVFYLGVGFRACADDFPAAPPEPPGRVLAGDGGVVGFRDEALFEIPERLRERDMVDVGVDKAANAWIEPLNVVDAALAQFSQWGQIGDNFPFMHNFGVEFLHAGKLATLDCSELG